MEKCNHHGKPKHLGSDRLCHNLSKNVPNYKCDGDDSRSCNKENESRIYELWKWACIHLSNSVCEKLWTKPDENLLTWYIHLFPKVIVFYFSIYYHGIGNYMTPKGSGWRDSGELPWGLGDPTRGLGVHQGIWVTLPPKAHCVVEPPWDLGDPHGVWMTSMETGWPPWRLGDSPYSLGDSPQSLGDSP